MNTRNLLIASTAALFGLSIAGASFASPDRIEPREARIVEHTSHADLSSRTDHVSHALSERTRDVAERAHSSADRSQASVDKVHDSVDKSKDAPEAPETNSGR